jgi:adenine-specific DNA-methyltransferase
VVVLTSTSSKLQSRGKNNDFRPIYYLGCKTSFTAAIKAAIDEVDPSGGRLVDLFSGTGSVGAALSAYREVTTVDTQEYSRVLCAAILNPPLLSPASIKKVVTRILKCETTKLITWCLQPLIEYESKCIIRALNGYPNALVELLESPPLAVRTASKSPLGNATSEVIRRLRDTDLWQAADTTVTRYFGGLYFSYEQAVMLDAALLNAEIYDEQHKNTLKAATLSTASQIVNTVGKQFAQPIQPRNKFGEVKPNLVKVVHRDRSLDVLELYQAWLGKYAVQPKALFTQQALRDDYLGAITRHGSKFSVVYADPPYTRDHYSRFYHVLETMCLRDNPAISQVMKDGCLVYSRGAYREDRHQSDFCIRSTAPAAFESLFKVAREHDLPMVLSYSPHEANDGTHPRVVSMSQIIEIANQHFNRVEVCSVDGVNHNMLNRSGLKLKKREQAEVLVKCFLE